MTAKEIVQQLTLEEKAALCSGKNFWHTKAVERLGIPSIMMCDGPHGLRKQEGDEDHLGINQSIETVCYPTAAALASSFDRSVMTDLGKALGAECRAENVGMLLGPGLNIKRSPLCGRNFEYFSEDPYLAGQIGAAYVKALQSTGVAACAKHFACNSQETRRMSGSSEVDERTLHEIYLPAFENVVKDGRTRSVMCAYNMINGEFCSRNKKLLTEILRDKWGFDGFVVTDWGAIKDRDAAVEAGLDLEMPGGPTADGAEIVKAVKAGTLSMEALDTVVERNVRFALESAPINALKETIDRDACRALAKRLAGECAVLLDNDGTLPLKEGAAVAFIGEFADKPRYQGAGSSHINVPHPVGAVEAANGMNVTYARGYDLHGKLDAQALLDEAVQAAAKADVAVVFAGLPDAFESEGADRAHMRLPDEQNALIAAVAKANAKTVVVLHGGSPMELPWKNDVQAILCMYLGGEQVGAATVDLLYGKVNPSGHLAESWPVRLQDTSAYLNFPGEDGIVQYAEGIFVGYRYYDKKEMAVNYPFGHGLTYTTFGYSNMTVDKDVLTDRDTLTVTVDVTNTGAVAGKTVVQVYVRDTASTVRRPVRELRAFEKVALQPGETKTVSFTLCKRAFAYYEPKINDWFVESGEFVIEVAESSRHIECEKTVTVTGTAELPLVITKYSPIGHLLRTEKGKAVFGDLMGKFAGGMDNDSDALGEGGDVIWQQMMMEMPLSTLVSFGMMNGDQLDALVASLN